MICKFGSAMCEAAKRNGELPGVARSAATGSQLDLEVYNNIWVDLQFNGHFLIVALAGSRRG